MLTSKQRAYLRKMAHDLTPIMTIGKEGLGENSLDQVRTMFPLHELIKINLLKTCDENPKVVAHQVAAATGSEVVQVVGHRFVLYRHSRKLAEKGKAISLPY